MALPSTGQISMAQVNTELGLTSTTLITLDQASVRSLAGVPSGQIALSNLWGKANSFSSTISSNLTNLNLRTYALAAGWNGSSALVVTINSGVYVYSTAVGTPAITISGSFPAGVTLVNNGYIFGMGGKGAGYGSSASESGGIAISLGLAVTINNQNGYIAGGGGGGGGVSYAGQGSACGGGGAGGGAGGSSFDYAGGAGGSVGASGSNGGTASYGYSGGGGGRIFSGSGGTSVTGTQGGGRGGGAGGSGAMGSLNASDYSGAGGSTNNAGGNALATSGGKGACGGGGGGWGASGGAGSYDAGISSPTLISAGAGGKAVNLGGYSVTWVGGFNSARVYGGSIMKTKISVQDVIRIGGCQSGLDRAIALGESVGIQAGSEVEFDQVIQICKDNGDEFLEEYFLKNKGALLEYSNKQTKCFVFMNKEFLTLENATQSKNNYLIERINYHSELVSVGYTESLGEDQSWITVDVDTFSINENVTEYHFHIFNHKTGQHIEAATIEEAKQIKLNLVNTFAQDDLAMQPIIKRSIYMEDGISTVDEAIE